MTEPRMARMALPWRDPVPNPPGHGDRGEAYKTSCSGPRAPRDAGPTGVTVLVARAERSMAAEGFWGTLTRDQYYMLRYGEAPPS